MNAASAEGGAQPAAPRPVRDVEIDGGVLGAVLHAAPDGLALVDGDGRLVVANPALERMFGYAAGTLIGRPIEDLVPFEHRRQHRVHRRTFVEAGRHRAMGAGLSLQGHRRDGRTFPIEVALAPVTLAAGPCTLAIVRDASDRREAEAQRRRAEHAAEVIEEQRRLTQGLHDDVLQDLYGVSLSLEAAAAGADHGRVRRAADDLAAIISRLRASTLALHRPSRTARAVRLAVLRRAAACGRALGVEPSVRFAGPVDVAVPEAVAVELQRVLDIALLRIEDIGRATAIEVTVAVDEGVRLTVVDHEPPRPAEHGEQAVPDPADEDRWLEGMRDRALALGGACGFERDRSVRSTLQWTAATS